MFVQFLAMLRNNPKLLLLGMAIACSIARNMYAKNINGREFKWTMRIWGLLGLVSELVPMVLWTALFLQLVGWEPVTSFAIFPAMLMFNWLYTSILFLIHWHFVRQWLGALAATLIEITWHPVFQAPVLQDKWENMIGRLATNGPLLVECFVVAILFFSCILLIWPQKPDNITHLLERIKPRKVGLLKRMRAWMMMYYYRARLVGFEVLAKNFFAGPEFLDRICMKIVHMLFSPVWYMVRSLKGLLRSKKGAKRAA